MMRVGIDALNAAPGGGLAYIKNICASLREQGIDYVVITRRNSEIERLEADHALVPWYGFRLSRLGWLRAALFFVFGSLTTTAANIEVLLITGVVRPIRLDVPSVLRVQNPYVADRPIGIGLRLRIVATILRWLIGRAMTRSQVVEVATQHWGELARRDLRGHGADLRVVPLGVDLGVLKAARQRPIPSAGVVAVGDVYPHKDYPTLLRAAAALAAEGHPVEVIIVGSMRDPKEWQRCQVLAKELRLDGLVRFLGALPHDEALRRIAGAGCFVLPSHAETFGFPLVEAMGMGTPVVAADIPVLRDVGADVPLYVPPGDASALARAIRATLDAPDANRSSRGVQRVRTCFDRQAVGRHEVSSLRDAMARGKAR